MAQPDKAPPVLTSGGAVSYRNEKGETSMQPVKVQRYIAGKRPEYAPESSDDDISDEDLQEQPSRVKEEAGDSSDDVEVQSDEDEERTVSRAPPLQVKREEDEDEEDPRLARLRLRQVELDEDLDGVPPQRRHELEDSGSSDDDEDLTAEELQARREELRARGLERDEAELLEVQEERSESEEESEYSEVSSSDEETHIMRQKPVFVQKKDRTTLQEKQQEERQQKTRDIETRKAGDEAKRQAKQLVEAEVKREMAMERTAAENTAEPNLADVNTDDEENAAEQEYEKWKLRELNRMKRDREEREELAREKEELGRIHGMTEDERLRELKNNPKLVTNKQSKGKYKFLQKYYHRGAFYLDKQEQVLARDHTGATLEDIFDKSVLPKVMQVKDFGRAGRTKWTHLVAEDTTQQADNVWAADTATNLKFHTAKGGGMKQIFARPTQKKRK